MADYSYQGFSDWDDDLSDDEPIEQSYEDGGAIRNLCSLQSRLNNIIKVAQSEACNKEQLAQLVQLAVEAKQDSNGISSCLSRHVHAGTYNALKQENSTAASRVFDIPELAEAILLLLSHERLWKMYRVSRGFKNTIEGSNKLQVKLWLKAAPLSTQFKILRRMPRRTIDVEQFSERFAVGLFQVYITLYTDSSSSHESRRSRTLICQPPVKRMIAYERFGRPENKKEVRSATGITIGQLYDTAEAFAGEARSRMPDSNIAVEVFLELPRQED